MPNLLRIPSPVPPVRELNETGSQTLDRMKVQLTTLATAGLAAGILGACAGVPPPEGPVPETTADALEVETVLEVVQEPEWTARERWESPFAVSGAGPTVVRGQRTVVVIDADSSIAAALARREEMERQPTRASTAGAVAVFAGDRDDGDSRAATGRSSSLPEAERDDREQVANRDDDEDERPAAADRPVGSTSTPTARGASTASRAEDADGDADEADEEPPTRAAAPTQNDADLGYHVVEEGETWSRVLIRYRLTNEALVAANPDVNPADLRAGQILRIPVPPPIRRSHRVAPGETIRDIARRYNVTPEEIREANRLANDRLLAGWTLIIPGSSNDDDR